MNNHDVVNVNATPLLPCEKAFPSVFIQFNIMYAEYLDTQPIPYFCDKSYDPNVEILKYIAQLLYLAPGAIFNSLVITTIFITNWKIFLKNSFFVLFGMDCIASLIMILIDLFLYRVMIYVTSLCNIFGASLTYPSLFHKIIYVLYQYAKAGKAITQMLMTINRLTCVSWGKQHYKIWKIGIWIAIILTLLLPFSVVWNPMFSRIFGTSYHGGIVVRFAKPSTWPAVVTFNLVLVITSTVVIIVCSVIIFHAMLLLPIKIKTREKALCIGSFIISIGFFGVLAFQSIVWLCQDCDVQDFNEISVYMSFCYDFLNVFSPIVMLFASSQLRDRILPMKYLTSSQVISIQNPPASQQSSSS